MLPRSSVFGPWELLDAVSRDRQELGLIIDLTFTSRYYDLQVSPCRTGLQGSGSVQNSGGFNLPHRETDPSLCEQDLPASLMFVKIFTAGHQVPSDGTILSFKRAVNNFLRDNQDNGDRPVTSLLCCFWVPADQDLSPFNAAQTEISG